MFKLTELPEPRQKSDVVFAFRVTKAESEKFNNFCETLNIKKTDVIRAMIAGLDVDLFRQ